MASGRAARWNRPPDSPVIAATTTTRSSACTSSGDAGSSSPSGAGARVLASARTCSAPSSPPDAQRGTARAALAPTACIDSPTADEGESARAPSGRPKARKARRAGPRPPLRRAGLQAVSSTRARRPPAVGVLETPQVPGAGRQLRSRGSRRTRPVVPNHAGKAGLGVRDRNSLAGAASRSMRRRHAERPARVHSAAGLGSEADHVHRIGAVSGALDSRSLMAASTRRNDR